MVSSWLDVLLKLNCVCVLRGQVAWRLEVHWCPQVLQHRSRLRQTADLSLAWRRPEHRVETSWVSTPTRTCMVMQTSLNTSRFVQRNIARKMHSAGACDFYKFVLHLCIRSLPSLVLLVLTDKSKSVFFLGWCSRLRFTEQNFKIKSVTLSFTLLTSVLRSDHVLQKK